MSRAKGSAVLALIVREVGPTMVVAPLPSEAVCETVTWISTEAVTGLMGTAPITHLSAPVHDHDIVTEVAPASVLPPPFALGAWNRSQRSVWPAPGTGARVG